MKLFSCLLDEIKDESNELSPAVIAMWIQGIFVFSLIWGLGTTLNLDSRRKFDVFLREFLGGMEEYPKPATVKLGKNNIFPERLTCFDYYFEKKASGRWNEWTDSIAREDNIIPDNAKVVELLIKTDETARQSFFLKTFMDHEVPLLFVGPTGIGKTAVSNNFLVKLPKEQ